MCGYVAGFVTCECRNCASARFFTIDAETGEIRTVRGLDRERQPLHLLQVTAADSAPDRRRAILNVSIAVQDVQDVIPIFTEHLYVADVPENEANYEVITVQVY